MTIEAAATPETAPVSEDTSLSAVMAMLDAEDDAQAKEPDAGDADEAPKQGDEVETADEADEAPEPAEPDAKPATVKVKVNGEEREVSLEEAIAGYSRNEDYKAKTAALADKGRTLESQYATQLQTMADRLLSFDPVLSEARTIDWLALSKSDPAEYVAKQAALQSRQGVLAQIQNEVARVEGEQTQATMQREYEALVSAIPQLADPGKAAKFDTELRTYLKGDLKFDDALINSVADHRFYLLAEKARQFDALQAAKASLPAKIVTPAKSVPTVRAGVADAPRSSPRKPSANAPERDRIAWLQRNV